MPAHQNSRCAACGSTVLPQATLCSHCGTPLRHQVTAATSLARPLEAAMPLPDISRRSDQPASPAILTRSQRGAFSRSSLIVLVLALLIAGLLLSTGLLLVRPHQPETPSSPKQIIQDGTTATTTQGAQPTQAHASSISWLSSAIDTSGGQPALYISGPAILEGDAEVNGTTPRHRPAHEGTLAVLLDATQYTVEVDNGTVWVPTDGVPTRSRIEAELRTIAKQLKSNNRVCSGGCSAVYVVFFRNGHMVDTMTL